MGKQERMEQLARLFEEGRIVIPSRMPVESSWRPESDASLALRFALSNCPWAITYRASYRVFDAMTGLQEAVEDIGRRLTLGDLSRMTMTNSRGEIVAQMYVLPDGCLHADSWLCPEGWK